VLDELDCSPAVHVVNEDHPIFLAVEALPELSTAAHIDVEQFSDLVGAWDGLYGSAYLLRGLSKCAHFVGFLWHYKTLDIDACTYLGRLHNGGRTADATFSRSGLSGLALK
jgi:hypothetical protein